MRPSCPAHRISQPLGQLACLGLLLLGPFTPRGSCEEPRPRPAVLLPIKDIFSCSRDGQAQPLPPLLFVVPGVTAADDVLPRPQQERSIYQGLRLDGGTVPLQLTMVLPCGDKVVLGARVPESPRSAEVPDGGVVPDAGPDAKSDAGPAAPQAAPPPTDAPHVLALLLQPSATAPAPGPPSAASISGVVRRRVGRQSLLAHGRFVGKGTSWAAIFKLRAEAVQLAIFGEDGSLRLYQTVPWRSSRNLRAKPVVIHTITDLSAPGRDGLLITGSGDGPVSAALVLEFGERSLTPYSPPVE